MQPHEIKPDTLLVTIIGQNAQSGLRRRYFNKILKHYNLNATAIALNIKEEQFSFVMENVAHSKVKKITIEEEFSQSVKRYMDNELSDGVDFIEIEQDKIFGFGLEDEVKKIFENPKFSDHQSLEVAKMMMIATRWFNTPFELDLIPIIL